LLYDDITTLIFN